jgi:hypothetical protein
MLCLGITSKWPVDIEAGMHSGRAPDMAALEKVGLARSQETGAEHAPLGTQPIKGKFLRYELTDEGKKFYREKEGRSWTGQKETQGDICYGQEVLDKIVKWEGPMALGDYKQVSVFYTYKIQNLAGWVKDANLQKTFPGVAATIDGEGKTVLNHTLTLTNQGWEPTGLDNP